MRGPYAIITMNAIETECTIACYIYMHHPLPSHSLGSGETGNDTKYDQLHMLKHATAVRLARGTSSKALIMGSLLHK